MPQTLPLPWPYIETTFNYMDKTMIGKTVTTMIKPKLEYATLQYSIVPSQEEAHKELERRQRITTNIRHFQ